jgi:dTDP-4-dehydrorhamnose reductase
MKILIFGASGHLGSLIFNFFSNKNYYVVGTYNSNKKKDLIEFDLTENSELSNELKNNKFDYFLWCIGYKDLLKTEDFNGETYKVNIVLLNIFIKKLIDYGINTQLIYISTDYVFDGLKGSYNEKEKPNPKTNYGLSKYLSELMLLNSYKKTTIIRTSAIMSNKSSFIKWFLNESNSNLNVSLFDDSTFSPTPASFFIFWLNEILQKKISKKIIHLSSEIKMTRFEFGEFILDNIFPDLKNNVKLIKIKSKNDLNFMQGDLSLVNSDFIEPLNYKKFVHFLKIDLNN